MLWSELYEEWLVTADGGGVGGDDTEDALDVFIGGAYGGDVAVFLSFVDGGVAKGEEAEVGGGLGGTDFGTGARASGHGRGDIGVEGTYSGGATAGEHEGGGGDGGEGGDFGDAVHGDICYGFVDW